MGVEGVRSERQPSALVLPHECTGCSILIRTTCRVCSLPRRFFVAPAKENSPRVRPLLEAMASGLPILASNVARYRWAVGGNESGLLVSTKQPGAWEEALLRGEQRA